MLRFYELFDPAEYQNSQRSIQEPTFTEEKEIAAGHYTSNKYEDEDTIKNQKSLQTKLISAAGTGGSSGEA